MNSKPQELTVWWALFRFRGRITRQTYFLGAALMLVVQIYIILNLALLDNNEDSQMAMWGFIMIASWILSSLAIFALTIKRLHDVDMSALFIALLFFPMVNLLFVIYLMLKSGSQNTNAHGPPPFAKQ